VKVSDIPPIDTLRKKIQINRFLSISQVVLYADEPYFVMLIAPINKAEIVKVTMIL